MLIYTCKSSVTCPWDKLKELHITSVVLVRQAAGSLPESVRVGTRCRRTRLARWVELAALDLRIRTSVKPHIGGGDYFKKIRYLKRHIVIKLES